MNSIRNFASSYTRAQSFNLFDGSSISPRDRRTADYWPVDAAVAGRETTQNGSEGTEEAPLLRSEDPFRNYSAANSSTNDSAAPTQNARPPLSSSSSDRSISSSHLYKSLQDSDGQWIKIRVGRSTQPQTVFNSINVLIGIGILSLPLAFQYSGWAFGSVLFAFSGAITLYTTILLARCMEADHSLGTYGDISYYAFGDGARVAVTSLFLLELFGIAVALTLVFADSLHVLFPQVSLLSFKTLSFFVFLPLAFLPLHLLSYSSIVGIIGSTSLLIILIATGVHTSLQPGSLLNPLPTSLFPENPWTFPLSIGLFMSVWGGHPVLVQLYRDQRHPWKFASSMTISWAVTFLVDTSMGVVGLLMFGRHIADEVTQSALSVDHYPLSIKYAILVICAAVPITKHPILLQPVSATFDRALGIDKSETRGPRLARMGVRLLVVFVPFIISIFFPNFDRIMASLL